MSGFLIEVDLIFLDVITAAIKARNNAKKISAGDLNAVKIYGKEFSNVINLVCYATTFSKGFKILAKNMVQRNFSMRVCSSTLKFCVRAH